jgi:lysine 2,3-aminomutase
MTEQENLAELEEPPSTDEPPPPWADGPSSTWDDWRWQLSNRLSTLEDFARHIHLTPDEVAGLTAPGCFHTEVTPYFASLIDPDDPNCPIRRQVIPTGSEILPFEAEMADALSEDAHSPVPGLVHRYPDRVLMLVTTQCASYCRFCTRSRMVGDPHAQFSTKQYEAQIAYIAAHPQIRDVLISGGDPLTLPQKVLEKLLARLREIQHVEIIRIGTRVPVFLPQRVTEDLTAMLRRYHPLWMNIHFNHPKEITPEVEAALARLANAGIPLGSQTVLLAGINDCPNVMRELVHRLVQNRVRPYYIYQCDLVHGAGHFRTPVAKGMEIIEALRGHTSGFAVPTFVIDAPEGGGKVPIQPNYLLSMSDSQVVVRNFEGFVSSYAQPSAYEAHDPATCAYCQAHRSEGKQEGVAGLLSGQARTIAPDGWQTLHRRGQEPQILPSGDLSQPRNGSNGHRKVLRTADLGTNKATPRITSRPKPVLPRTPRSMNISHRVSRRGWRVGLVYNLKASAEADPEAPPDALAEFDSVETVEALEAALRSAGHQVIRLEADETFVDTVRQAAPDICFNIAEGIQGETRESHVPAVLQMLGIPFTASGVLGHTLSLDKAAAKRIWRDVGLPTAPFQVFRTGEEALDRLLTFPLFVKPLREGTGMGINSQSVVHSEAELRHQVQWTIDAYRQPALVEGYLPGREFTVGFIGNVQAPRAARRSDLYDRRGFHLFPILEIDANVGDYAGLYNSVSKLYLPGDEEAPLYFCPADVPSELETELKTLAVEAFQALGAFDVSRVDFRLGSDGRPYLMEINTLPGMNPKASDLCIMARAEGMGYAVLINEILYLAAERYGLKAPSLGSVLWRTDHQYLPLVSLNSPVPAPLTLGGVG